MFDGLLGWCTIYTFSGALAPNGILPRAKFTLRPQNSLCVQVLRSPIFAALLHDTRLVGVSQTLRRSADGATYIRQGGHHVWHRPTFHFQLFPLTQKVYRYTNRSRPLANN